MLAAFVVLFLATFLSLSSRLFVVLAALVVPLLDLCLLLVAQGFKRRRGLSPPGFLSNLCCNTSPGAAQQTFGLCSDGRGCQLQRHREHQRDPYEKWNMGGDWDAACSLDQ